MRISPREAEGDEDGEGEHDIGYQGDSVWTRVIDGHILVHRQRAGSFSAYLVDRQRAGKEFYTVCDAERGDSAMRSSPGQQRCPALHCAQE